MAIPTGKKPTARIHAPNRPLFERVQDWVFQMDVGMGTSLFRVGMFALLVLFIMLLYTGTQFYGLREAGPMDMGQIARNLYLGRGYSTQCIRPLELAHLIRIGKQPINPQTVTQPELFTPPVYPIVLAATFKLITPNFDIGSGRTVKADRLLMLISWVFYLVGMGLLYMVAREMFDHRVAVLSLFLYLFCEPLLDAAIAGVHLNFLLVLFLLAAFGVIKAERWQLAGESGWWTASALVVSSLAVSLGTLTQYTFGATLLPLLVYVIVSFPKTWTRWVLLCVSIYLLVFLPWMARNYKTSRTLFGLTYYQVFEGTGEDTDKEVRPGDLQRTYDLARVDLRLRSLLRKFVVNAQTIYERTGKDVGGNYLIAFFLVSLLHRWRSEEVYRLRRFVFWSLLFTIGWLACTGPPERNFFVVYMPVIIVYAAAFFYVLFERLQFRTRIMRYGMVLVFVLLNSIPFIIKILPPATTVPYPPYDGGVARAVGRLPDMPPNAVMASDIPWALAWYGDRSTIWMPVNDEEYLAINDQITFIAGIYLTQATIGQLEPMDLAQALLGGKRLPWVRLFPLQMPPPTFPLKSPQMLTPDRQQFLISNLRGGGGPP